MNIIIISLERALERRIRIKNQLEKLGLDAIIMDAIDGNTLDEAQINKYIQNPGRWRDGDKFKPGEIGCLLSHIKAIKLAKENNYDNVLILEDDVILSSDFNNHIKFLFRIIPPDWEHIFLGGHIYMQNPPVLQPTVISSDFKISGAYSYFIRNSIYDKILDKLSLMRLPVDDVFEHLIFPSREIESFIFFPFLTYPIIENSYIWNIEGNNKIHPSFKYFKK